MTIDELQSRLDHALLLLDDPSTYAEADRELGKAKKLLAPIRGASSATLRAWYQISTLPPSPYTETRSSQDTADRKSKVSWALFEIYSHAGWH